MPFKKLLIIKFCFKARDPVFFTQTYLSEIHVIYKIIFRYRGSGLSINYYLSSFNTLPRFLLMKRTPKPISRNYFLKYFLKNIHLLAS